MITMTTQDQNKKTLRHFQCRDYLWEIFEQMSAELECSTDYLINEAMRQYARSRNYGTSRRGTTMPPASDQSPAAAPVSGTIPSLRENAGARGAMPTPPPPRTTRATLPQTPAAAPRIPSSMPPPPRAPVGAQRAVSMPPPLPGANRSVAPAPGGVRSQLYVIFNGQKMPVNKDEFIIGRGSKSADLAIKDGNISRRHAAVVWHNGAY